ncbi:MAG: CDP-glucose 4,6-dehydratase [Pseudomonadota bacterium]
MKLKAEYADKKVLVTGHTGFKGAWLTQWLLMMGARVYGYALEPPTSPALFDQLGLGEDIEEERADIRDFARFRAFLERVKPDIVFHLAAQSLVRDSYQRPLETAEVNTLGTAYVLEAVRQVGLSMTVILVTSDKCYSNQEWLFGYRENDPMGGHDVYSASKGAAELLIDSWRMSFFHPSRLAEHGVLVASVRAGNVIGGGDWAKDRIVPDCVRALLKGEAIEVRNPTATRPWQHVLEPLAGYLQLGALLLDPSRPLDERARFCAGFNFGPLLPSNQPVRVLTERAIDAWGSGSWRDLSDPHAPHEAQLLQLAIEKAYHMLGWIPCWDFDATVRRTIEWYRDVMVLCASPSDTTMQQIRRYEREASGAFS